MRTCRILTLITLSLFTSLAIAQDDDLPPRLRRHQRLYAILLQLQPQPLLLPAQKTLISPTQKTKIENILGAPS